MADAAAGAGSAGAAGLLCDRLTRSFAAARTGLRLVAFQVGARELCPVGAIGRLLPGL